MLPGRTRTTRNIATPSSTLNEAVLNRRTLHMRYRTGRTGAVSTRELDPYRVWYRSGGLYVVGLDHKSGRDPHLRGRSDPRARGQRATVRGAREFRFRPLHRLFVRRHRRPAARVRILFERAGRPTSKSTTGTRASVHAAHRRTPRAQMDVGGTPSCAPGFSPSAPAPRCSSPRHCAGKSRGARRRARPLRIRALRVDHDSSWSSITSSSKMKRPANGVPAMSRGNQIRSSSHISS